MYNSTPKFAFRLLEKLIHQDEINDILEKFGHLTGVEFIVDVLDYLKIKRTVKNLENIPVSGRYIFVSNHPLGGIDGFVLAEAIKNRFGSIKIVVNDILMNLEPLNNIFTPINKHGRQSSQYAKMLNELYTSNTPILYFPAGLCSRKIDGVVKDTEWKRNFVQKAKEYGRDIVPMFVENINSKAFYNTSSIRKFFGVKANIEMVLLPSELFKMRNKAEIKVFTGDLISNKEIKNSEKTNNEWCKIIRTKCYDLRNNINTK